MTHLLSLLTIDILALMTHLSYGGIILLMAIESCNIPLPSELIMPFAGYLVSTGVLNIFLAACAGAIGCVIGSTASYYLGYYGGRPLLDRYGKYILLTKHDLDTGEALFHKHGDKIAFIARLLPVIRTFISFPAGIVRMDIKKFMIYSFSGSFIWSLLLAYIGYRIGKNQTIIATYFHRFDILIALVVVIGLGAYIYTHIKKLKA